MLFKETFCFRQYSYSVITDNLQLYLTTSFHANISCDMRETIHEPSREQKCRTNFSFTTRGE